MVKPSFFLQSDPQFMCVQSLAFVRISQKSNVAWQREIPERVTEAFHGKVIYKLGDFQAATFDARGIMVSRRDLNILNLLL